MSDVYWTGYDKKPIGGGNPYYCCVGCGRSDPEINGDIANHAHGCPEVVKYAQAARIAELEAALAHEREAHGHTQEALRGFVSDLDAVKAERDALAARVKELEGALVAAEELAHGVSFSRDLIMGEWGNRVETTIRATLTRKGGA